MDHKRRHALKLQEDMKLEVLSELGERGQNDAQMQKAKEIFRRPAFQGTELEPRQQATKQ